MVQGEVRWGGVGDGVVSVVVAFVAVFSMGGVVFGFNSLAPSLYARGTFVSSCSVKEVKACGSGFPDGCCGPQRERMALAASLALFAADGVMVAYGEANDRLGAAWCMAAGEALCVAGFCVLSVAATIKADVWIAVALVFLGLGGPGVFMGCLRFGDLVPGSGPTVAAATAAAFDASALVFVLIDQLTRHSTLADATLVWAALSAGVATVSLRLLLGLERRRFSSSNTTTKTERRLLRDDDAKADMCKEPLLLEHHEASEKTTVWQQLVRRDTVLLVAFMAAYNLKSSFFIETVADHAAATDPDTAASVSQTFDLAFPIGGFCSSFAVAVFLQRFRDAPAVTFGLVAILAVLVSACHLAPRTQLNVAAAILFGPARTVQWANYFHFLTANHRYPPSVVGRLLGYSNLAVALVSDLTVPLLTAFVQRAPDRQQQLSRYLLLNLGLFVLVTLSASAFLAHLLGFFGRWSTGLCRRSSSFVVSSSPRRSSSAVVKKDADERNDPQILASPPPIFSHDRGQAAVAVGVVARSGVQGIPATRPGWHSHHHHASSTATTGR